MPSQDAAQLQHLRQVAEQQEAVIERQTTMDKRDLHVSRRSKHSDFNLTKSDVKVRTNNRNESPFKSMRDSHSVWSFTPDIGITVSWPTAGAPSGSATRLELCRKLLATPYSDLLPRPTDYPDFGARLRLCPKCGIGTMIRIQVLFPCHGPVPMLLDTS